MVGQDQLLGAGPVDDVRRPIVEIGRTPPRDGDATHTQASPALHLRKWFPTAVHRALFLQKRLGRNDRGAKLNSTGVIARQPDRKSTRLNSSHITISYAVFCLKKKNCT